MKTTATPTPPRLAAATAATAVIGSVSLALGAGPASAATLDVDEATRLHVAAHTRSIAATQASAPTPASHTVEPGDTVSTIADRYGLRTTDVLAWNALDRSSIIHPGQVLVLRASATPAAAAATLRTHTVAAGDTLWAVADAAGISLDSLFAANGLTGSSIIYPGQVLIVPELTTAASGSSSSASAVATGQLGLDAEQIANARTIIDVGRSRGVSDRGIAVALATAMVESWLRNLDWGDRDSLGVFQQRPSMGWGTADEIADTARAAAAFFGGASDPNGTRTRGLLDIAGWESMEFGAAAQAVQVSAYPERYAQWEQDAYAWLAALG